MGFPDMRIGLLVVISLFVAGLVIGGAAFWRTSQRALMVEDLFTALAYYAEAHDGALPASVDELAASPFIARRDDGALLVSQRDATQLRRSVYGRPIVNIERFKIPWGVHLTTLRIDPEGAVRDESGGEVRLIDFGGNPDLSRRFSRDLLLFAHDADIIPDPRRDPNVTPPNAGPE